jgi:hypothetical protein
LFSAPITGNKNLSKGRANNIKKYLVSTYPNIDLSRLKFSGINKPEKIKMNKGQFLPSIIIPLRQIIIVCKIDVRNMSFPYPKR